MHTVSWRTKVIATIRQFSKPKFCRMLLVPGFNSFALTAPDVYLGSSSDYRSFYRKCPQEPELTHCNIWVLGLVLLHMRTRRSCR